MAGLLGSLYSTIDSAKRKYGGLLSDFARDPVTTAQLHMTNVGNAAKEQDAMLSQLYMDDQGKPTMNPAKWSAAAKAAEAEMRQRALGAVVGAVNWSGGPMPSGMARFGDEIDANVMQSPRGVVTLSKVVVPKDQRGQGIGSDFMGELTKTADENGQTLALTPSTDFGGTKSGLLEFYKRFGFVPNKGKNKDFGISEAMLRAPTGEP